MVEPTLTFAVGWMVEFLVQNFFDPISHFGSMGLFFFACLYIFVIEHQKGEGLPVVKEPHPVIR